MAYFLGVDVGTASVRAVLIDENGQTIDSQSEKLEIFRPKIGRYEQSTDQIWEAICSAVISHFLTVLSHS